MPDEPSARILARSDRRAAKSSGSQWLGTAVAVLLAAYPALLLVVPGAVNTAYVLLLLLSTGILAGTGWQRVRSAARQAPDTLLPRSQVWAFSLAMAGLPLSIFFSQIANQRWGWPYYDAPSRFLFSIPIFFALRRIAPAHLRAVQYGLIAGALTGAFAITYAPTDWGSGRLGSSFVNPIHFGDLALTLGVLAAFSIDWQTRDAWWLRLLKIFALFAGLYASMATGARGGWAALPAFAVLWFWFQRKRLPASRLAWYASGALALAFLTYVLLPEVHQRINLIGANLLAYQGGHDNTSIGIRFQLWRVALLIFAQHPLFGVGLGGYKALMPEMQHAGLLSPLAAQFGAGEVHSEILSKLSQLGLVGLVAILSVYVVPAALFLRALRQAQHPRMRSAQMGLVLVTGFLIYGLTVETFDLTMTAAFYALSVAVLLACTYNNHQLPEET